MNSENTAIGYPLEAADNAGEQAMPFQERQSRAEQEALGSTGLTVRAAADSRERFSIDLTIHSTDTRSSEANFS